jgi:hypothetical protein
MHKLLWFQDKRKSGVDRSNSTTPTKSDIITSIKDTSLGKNFHGLKYIYNSWNDICLLLLYSPKGEHIVAALSVHTAVPTTV